MTASNARTFKELADLFSSLPVSNWGIAAISGLHPLSFEYPQAISILVSYAPGFQIYSEEAFHEILKLTAMQIEAAVKSVCDFLVSARIGHLSIARGGQDPVTLLAAFPHKLAAARAGLGWIGKNSLLVTKDFGLRVRLSTILINSDFPCATPVTESQCGQCAACVASCPYNCIRGVNWTAGMPRETLIDARLCSSVREAFESTIGRKHECGFCLLSCPVGNSSGEVICPATRGLV